MDEIRTKTKKIGIDLLRLRLSSIKHILPTLVRFCDIKSTLAIPLIEPHSNDEMLKLAAKC